MQRNAIETMEFVTGRDKDLKCVVSAEVINSEVQRRSANLDL